MKYILGIVLSCFVLLSGCNLGSDVDPANKNEEEIQNYIKLKNLKLQKSPEGMYYQTPTASGAGIARNTGDLVTFHYKMTLLDGNVIDSTSRSKNINRSLVWGANSAQSIFALPLSFLKEGETGLFIIPSALAFGGTSYGDVPAYSVIRLDLTIDAIRNEDAQIAFILKTYGIDNPEKTSSGLFFKKLVDNPTGASVAADAPVLVNYTGRLGYSYVHKDATSGAIVYNPIFDSGTLGTPTVPFVLSQRSLIPGFTEALKKMRVGEKAAVVMPHELAYGTAGNSAIPGYSPLYFEISIIAP